MDPFEQFCDFDAIANLLRNSEIDEKKVVGGSQEGQAANIDWITSSELLICSATTSANSPTTKNIFLKKDSVYHEQCS